jgi:hypothetical protein
MNGRCALLLPLGLLAAVPARSAATLFPEDRLYPYYTADPRSAEFGVAWLEIPDPALADSGSSRLGLKLGGRFGLLRLHPRDRPAAGWQLDIEAGFVGQFDLERSLDNLGWDGTYALLASTRLGGGTSLQLGTKHVSSHVGDEYTERTGRGRLGYTREELTAGIAWSGARGERVYAEAGWDWSPKEPLGQEAGRLQAGGELHRAAFRRWPRLGWYTALNLEATEERGWRRDATLEAGLRVASGARRWRIAVQLYDGRVPLGEFFRSDEGNLALGLWLEP